MIRDPHADLPDFDDVIDASRHLEGVATHTPLMRSDYLDEIVGAEVWIKPECLQRTGSFKMRGAWNRISRIPIEERARGVVAFSSGNHAQGVAESARLLGIGATIVMPADAPDAKISATRRRGAVVWLYDRQTQSREAIGAEIANASGATLIKPYDDAWVIAGQGTAGLEAIRDGADTDVQFATLLCTASGGGLMAGVALAFGELSPDTRLLVCEPAGHDDHVRSLIAGEKVANTPGVHSIGDALLAPEPGDLTFAINQDALSGGFAVADLDILNAMKFAFEHLKLVVEPGGAVALAALLANRKMMTDSGPILVLLTGGNVDPAQFSKAILSAP